MKGLVHKTLIAVPPTVATLGISAAGVWPGARDKIAGWFTQVLTAISNPIMATVTVVFVIAYVALIFWTSEGSAIDAEAKAKLKAEKLHQRRHIVSVGRSLAHGFRKSNGYEHIDQFMREDSGYARIRPHLSRNFHRGAFFNKQMAVDALLDEMDRLERKWRLV